MANLIRDSRMMVDGGSVLAASRCHQGNELGIYVVVENGSWFAPYDDVKELDSTLKRLMDAIDKNEEMIQAVQELHTDPNSIRALLQKEAAGMPHTQRQAMPHEG